MTMNARWIKIATRGSWLLCLALSLLWLRSHASSRQLDAECAVVHTDNRQLAQRASALERTTAGIADEIATKRNVLGVQSLGSPWRATVLPVIARLKQQQELSPPPPRRPGPPSGPNGIIFPELMSNPEYSRLVFLLECETTRQRMDATLAGLGLTVEAAEKVISLLAEKQVLRLDYLQLAGDNAHRDGFARAQQKQRQEIDLQIRAVMGDKAYQNFDSDAVFTPRMTVAPLEVRLSYSESPLRPQQADWLAALAVAGDNHRSDPLFNESLLHQARTILDPAQWEALRQLQAERRAHERRAKLPKSSELPSNR
jgi:hypothetical protein